MYKYANFAFQNKPILKGQVLVDAGLTNRTHEALQKRVLLMAGMAYGCKRLQSAITLCRYLMQRYGGECFTRFVVRLQSELNITK